MKERGPGRSRTAADRRYQSRLNKRWDELKWLYLAFAPDKRRGRSLFLQVWYDCGTQRYAKKKAPYSR